MPLSPLANIPFSNRPGLVKKSRNARVLFFGGTILSFGGAGLLIACQPLREGFEPWFFLGLAGMAAGMILLWQGQSDKRGLLTMLFFALVLRLIFLAWPHNSDLNRYIWEGQIQNVGLNPYLIAPSSPATEPFRNAIWNGVNHKNSPSLYGPLAQLVFRVAAHSPDPASTLKGFFLICDLGVLCLLLLALEKSAMPRHHGWLYAAHPLPPLLLVGEGHLEPLLILPLFAGLLAIHWRRYGWGLLLFSLASTVKISMVILLPFIVRRMPKKVLPLMLLPLCLWLPFGDGFLSHLKTLGDFAGTEPFNSLAYLLGDMFFPTTRAGVSGPVIFALGFCFIYALDLHHLRAALLLLGLYLLCSPVVHPWYFAILLPLAVLYRSLPWLVLSTTASLLLYVTLRFSMSGDWHVPAWLTALEFIPFLIAFLYSAGHGRSPLAPIYFPPPTRLSVLIPVYNEAENLSQCLESIVIPSEIPAEIIVIDGGSKDNTMALAKDDLRTRSIASSPGRGTQIAAGYRVATGDLLIIVHADTRLGPDTIKDIWQYCTTHIHVAGGACPARYRHPSLRFRLTELLNNLRVRWLGIAFGDQVQFFRRGAIAPENFPDYRLMEDIELSLMTQQAGALAFVDTPVFASHRRWERVGYSRNTLQVISLFSIYLFLRSLGLVRDKGEAFFRYYYGSKRGKN